MLPTQALKRAYDEIQSTGPLYVRQNNISIDQLNKTFASLKKCFDDISSLTTSTTPPDLYSGMCYTIAELHYRVGNFSEAKEFVSRGTSHHGATVAIQINLLILSSKLHLREPNPTQVASEKPCNICIAKNLAHAALALRPSPEQQQSIDNITEIAKIIDPIVHAS